MVAVKFDPAFDLPDPTEEEAPEAPQRRDIAPVPRISIQAFCETHEVQAAIEAAGEDRRMARAHLKVQTGGLPAATEYYRDSSTPNLIILETTEKRKRLIEELERFAEVCDPSSKVIIIGHVNDILLYRELMRQGVSEYVVTPVSALDIVEIASSIYSDRQAKPIGRLIAFVSAKGGVGASVLAHNVAWTIAEEFKSETLVADMDLAFGTANLDFNQDPAQGIAEAVHAPDRLDANFLDRLLASCAERLHLLAAPSTLDRTCDFGDQAFEPLIDLVRNTAPFVVLDVPHQWTAWTKRTLIAADEIILVASPDLANLRNAKNLADILRQARPHDPPPRLVLNQVGMPKRPEIKPTDFAKALDLPIAASIPFDANLFGLAANNGQMLVQLQKSSRVVEQIRALAELVADRPAEKKVKAAGGRSLLGALGNLMPSKKSRGG